MTGVRLCDGRSPMLQAHYRFVRFSDFFDVFDCFEISEVFEMFVVSFFSKFTMFRPANKLLKKNKCFTKKNSKGRREMKHVVYAMNFDGDLEFRGFISIRPL